MSGFPRDLAAVEPWQESLARSRTRRGRAAEKPARGRKTGDAGAEPLSTLLAAPDPPTWGAIWPTPGCGSSHSAAPERADAPRSCGPSPRARARSEPRWATEAAVIAFQRSSGLPTCERPFSINRLLGAYGVSCRARVTSTLRHTRGDSPPQSHRPHSVPRSMAPWGHGLGTNGGHAGGFFCKMRDASGIVTIVADASKPLPRAAGACGRQRS
jgi:hypothetical protein